MTQGGKRLEGKAMSEGRGFVRGGQCRALQMARAGLLAALALSLARARGQMGCPAGPITGPVPRVVHVSAGVMDSIVVRRVEPENPAATKDLHAMRNGTVVLRVRINKRGVPVAIRVAEGLRADYDRHAKAAVWRWRWRPYLLNCRPVAVETFVNLQYPLVM